MRRPLYVGVALLLAACRGPAGPSYGVYQEPYAKAELPAPLEDASGEVLWRRDVGDTHARGLSNLVPAPTGRGVVAAGRDGQVVHYDRDGARLWEVDLDAPIRAGVAVGRTLAAVSLDDGTVVALELDTGDLRWRAELGRSFPSRAALGGGRVVLRSADGLVMALNQDDGRVVWQQQHPVPGFRVHGEAPPVAVAEAVLIGLPNGEVVANNLRNGRDYWRTSLALPLGENEFERLIDLDAHPLVAGDSLFMGAWNNGIAALELISGKLRWRADVSSRKAFALDGWRLFATAVPGGVLALDARNGNLLWHQQALRGHGSSAPVICARALLAGDAAGRVHGLDMANGALRHRFRLSRDPILHLLPLGDACLAFSASGELIAFTPGRPG